MPHLLFQEFLMRNREFVFIWPNTSLTGRLKLLRTRVRLPWAPEVYTLPIQTAGRRLAKRADSTKRAKCWSRVTSGSNRQKPHLHVNVTLLWSRLILVSDQTGFPTWEVKYKYHMSCRVYFSRIIAFTLNNVK